jgi:hypothetical protein
MLQYHPRHMLYLGLNDVHYVRACVLVQLCASYLPLFLTHKHCCAQHASTNESTGWWPSAPENGITAC